MGSDVVFGSLYLDSCVRITRIVYGSSLCTIIITYWMLTETWTWSLPYGAPEIHLASSALLDAWMPPCLSIWEMRFTDLRGGHVLDDRRFHDTCSFDLSCTRCSYWGIFSVLDEGHISVRMRFIDHEESRAYPYLARSRFTPFDIVVIPGRSCLWCLDFPRHHSRGPWRRSLSHISVAVSITRLRYIVFASLTIILELFIDMSSQRSVVRGLVESLSAISSGLRFAVACHTGIYYSPSLGVQILHHFSVLAFRAIIASQFGVQSHHQHFQFGVQSHRHHYFQFGVQSLHHRFSVLAFRAIIAFQFGVQSLHHFSVSAFRAFITSQFWHSEPSSLLSSAFRAIISIFSLAFRAFIITIFSFGVQSHHRFLVWRSEPSSLFSFGVQSHHRFSVLAFRAIIGF
ncbi:hypothetical protein CK203_026315 [Vitis vinifera]|uniref:Uncharacterized protein n=1 Tax=Vitis vinifera TaxID=29760 RepID=A0A438IKW8_VITVI|nr:hypothetical protein CK203_026315 [Vitis vinifera]